MTTLHDFGSILGRPLDAFFLGSHNFMVTALWLVCEVALIISVVNNQSRGQRCDELLTPPPKKNKDHVPNNVPIALPT